MQSEHWKQVDRLLEDVLDLPEKDRTDFLDKTCAGNAAMREELDDLLSAHERAGGFMDALPSAYLTDLFQGTRPFITEGESLTHYSIIRLLGAGGMGDVYLARDNLLERNVAIKVIADSFLADEDARKRVLREAKAAATLDHPNICSIYEVGEENGLSFIVMQYIDGQTLDRTIAAAPLPLSKALDIARQIAEALREAHSKSIAHCDIKPQNIMLTTRGQVKIMDFGLAQSLMRSSFVDGEAETINLSSSPNVIAGTVPYMSPEQLKGEALDGRSDIFSFGVVLYEMIIGKHPFIRPSFAETMSAVLSEEPYFGADSSIPPAIRSILGKCMAKDRRRRYEAGELMSDLTKLDSGTAESERALDLGPSIAVLPFANISIDPDNDYFCDGLAEELINSLTRIEGLRVAARTSAFFFKGKRTDVREIGAVLNVTSVLEGGVRKSGDRLRITAHLTNVVDGYQIWSARFDRKMQDIFDIQDEITFAIVDALKFKLLIENRGALVKRFTDNTRAHECYLRGRFHMNKFTEADFGKAIEFFGKSIKESPRYAPAYAGLAQCYTVAAFGDCPPSDVFPKAEQAAIKALEIDDGLAEAHTSLAIFKMYYERDWSAAEKEFTRAIEINPGDPSSHRWYGWFLGLLGRFEPAGAEIDLARDLDPLDVNVYGARGKIYYWSRSYSEAVQEFLKALEIDPHSTVMRSFLLRAYIENGDQEKAEEELERMKNRQVDSVNSALLGYAYAVLGDRDEAEKQIKLLKQLSKQRYVASYHFASIYIAIDEIDKALDSLEKAFRERSVWLAWLKVEPEFDRLRSNPRFEKLLQRVGFCNSVHFTN
jgi:eukaryotic-like serine/threonine-protein kinase